MNSSSTFYNALVKFPSERNGEDLAVIFNHLRRLDVFERLTDAPLRSVCKTARLERHPANYVLFRKGQLATCWFILLSGSVFMNKQIYLPIGCFGKRSSGMNLRRMSDCIVISPSDLIVIDYPDVQRITVHLNNNGQQQPSTSSASSSTSSYHSHPHRLPASAQPFSAQNQFPSTSSSSALMPTNSAVKAEHLVLARRRSSEEQPAHGQQHHHHHQQLVFHRFPAPLPPSTAHPHHSFHYQQQCPSNYRRVPSPAPVSSSHSASPAKHLNTSTGCLHNQHTKSNSVSEDRELQPPRRLHQHQQQFRQQNEAPFLRMRQLAEAASVKGQQRQQQGESAKQANRAPFLHIMAGSNSLVQEKKSIFEAKGTIGITTQQNEQETIWEKREGRQHHLQKEEEPDESTLKKEKSNNITQQQPFSSNFQRLSKVRLNMSRKLNSLNAAPTENNHSVPVDQMKPTISVRIRHQSPQQRIAIMRQNASASRTSSVGGDEPDCFAGLPETAVDDSEGLDGDDDDEEEDEEGSCPSHDSVQELRDSVRECLERPPEQRTSEDLAILIEFLDSLPTLASLPMSIKRQLCLKMVFAHVPNKGTVIMAHGERIDAWSVVVNGSVEHLRVNGQRAEYAVGDCFGVQPVAQAQFNDGEIRTMVNDCEFILVEHSEFHSIMSNLVRKIEQENDKTGEVIREVERRVVDNQVELIITKASPERLLQQLLVDEEAGADAEVPLDSHFVEDFLLMHRVFFPDSSRIVRQLINWFSTESAQRDRVARILLMWLNNHFEDFEGAEAHKQMTNLLYEFDELLAEAKMFNHQSLFSITVSVKSQPRIVTLTRSDRAELLDFDLVGGQDGIFVSSINPNSAAERSGLKKWDEVLEVNRQNCRKLTLERVVNLLRESTHLSLTVKTNWIGCKEALLEQIDQVDSAPVPPGSQHRTTNSSSPQCLSAVPARYQKKSSVPMLNSLGGGQQRERRSTLCSALQQQAEYEKSHQHIAGTATPSSTGSNNGVVGGGGMSSKKVLSKLLHIIRGGGGGEAITNDPQMVDSADELCILPTGGGSLRASRSNPDISAHSIHSSTVSNRHSSFCTNNDAGTSGNCGYSTDQVLKVYRADQSFRYVLICPETTVRQLLHLALQEFGIQSSEEECWWALYECSVGSEGVSKQRRLPDLANNLVDRVGLSARLYLRDMQRAEESALLPDELVPDLLKQARTTLYTLNAQGIAAQLTLQDFAVFSSIEPTEYVNNLFKLTDNEDPCAKRCKGWPRLEEFEALFNREMWWVATEVCCERNVYRRSKLVKKFIKIARHCHLLRNLNSMFAIVSGLEKPAVRRLMHTWERVPGKYLKMLADLQQMMDPSRNMSRYRQHLAQLAQEPPVIPIYPVLRKDLIFAHEANATFCGPLLVNFEKLRMIAQIVRGIQRFSSTPYDQGLLIGANDSDALLEPSTIRKGSTLLGSQGSRFGTSGGGGMSRKKLYERTLMLKRVKVYLHQMPIIDSEVELDRISLECEPPMTGGNSSSAAQLFHQQGSSTPSRRRMPSPSPSSVSSQSNQSNSVHRIGLPKFGVESPQAVQKMLSLVQNSKIKSRVPAERSRTVHSRTEDGLPPSGFDLHHPKRASVASSGENSNHEKSNL